jgi:hypothetical protein
VKTSMPPRPDRTFCSTFWCESITPLGRPVVPEV